MRRQEYWGRNSLLFRGLLFVYYAKQQHHTHTHTDNTYKKNTKTQITDCILKHILNSTLIKAKNIYKHGHLKRLTKGLSNLAKTAPNDPAWQTDWQTDEQTDRNRLTDRLTDRHRHIGNNSLHLMHSKQIKNVVIYENWHKTVQYNSRITFGLHLSKISSRSNRALVASFPLSPHRGERVYG